MTATGTAPATPAIERGPTVWSRLSDSLNPILVREVQQAVKGRVFPLTILIALAISVVIAAVVATDYVAGEGGRNAFDAGFATLVPLVVFVVPMQAYQSMRTELKGGIVEQLLLSRLSPGAVLSGKLQAAMVQFVLYVSVLSPLLATSYLLRGVDLPTIGISLAFALVVCVAATAFAVSSAAQAIVPSLQPLANLGIAFGLGVATFALVGFVGSGEYTAAVGSLLRSGSFAAIVSGIVLVALLTTSLSWLAARSYLLHAFDNRSTGFRVFLFSLPPLAYGWMVVFIEPRWWSQAFPVITFVLLVAAIVFGVFMVTEQRQLSPRVQAHVPRGALAASLAAPFLPGRDRGLLCFLLYTALLAVVAVAFWPANNSAGFSPAVAIARVGPMTLAYGLVYLGIGRWVRHRLPETTPGNHAGRFLLPVMLFVFCVVPLLIDVFTRGRAHRWHIGHALNPFFTIEEFVDDEWYAAWPYFLAVIVVAVVVQLPTGRRGIREVAAAAAERRARAPGPPVGA